MSRARTPGLLTRDALGSVGESTLEPGRMVFLPMDSFALDCRPRQVAETIEGAAMARGQREWYPHPVAPAFNVIDACQANRMDPTEARNDSGRIDAGVQSLDRMQRGHGSFRYPVAVPRYRLSPGRSCDMAQRLVVAARSEAGPILFSGLTQAALLCQRRAADHLRTDACRGGCTSYVWGGPFSRSLPQRFPLASQKAHALPPSGPWAARRPRMSISLLLRSVRLSFCYHTGFLAFVLATISSIRRHPQRPTILFALNSSLRFRGRAHTPRSKQ